MPFAHCNNIILNFTKMLVLRTLEYYQLTGGSNGGVAGVATPLNFLKKNSGHPRGRCDKFTCVAVVIDLLAWPL